MKKIAITQENVKIMGRINELSSGELQLLSSASGIEFTFTGRKLNISVSCNEKCPAVNSPRIAILINDRFVVKKNISSCETYDVFKSSCVKSINVKIIKLSEAAFSSVLIQPIEIEDDETITPVPNKPLKIEFIGDSITCGYGVDSSEPESPFSTSTENAMKTYAFLTARILNADYSFFSASGYGVISGYTDDGIRNFSEIIPPFYENTGLNSEKWDFKKFIPDIIVINLGTNDYSYCRDDTELRIQFENKYFDFLKIVRKNNSNSEIFCVLGIMETNLFPQVKNAAERFCRVTGDKKIHTFEFECQNGLLGFASNWHPSEDTHAQAAETLAEYIKYSLAKKFRFF